MLPNPFETSKAVLEIPILKLLGWNLSTLFFPPLIPPVVINDVIEKLIAF